MNTPDDRRTGARQHISGVRPGVALMLVAVLTGGCSFNTWRTALLREDAPSETALVTFVRPAVFMGDAVDAYVWDGSQFVGALGAGTLLQYTTKPGAHLFVGNGKEPESWAFVRADLQAGKQYILKMKVYPGIFSAQVGFTVVPKTDTRVSAWIQNLKPVTTNPEKMMSYSTEKQNAVDNAIYDFKTGKLTTYITLSPDEGR